MNQRAGVTGILDRRGIRFQFADIRVRIAAAEPFRRSVWVPAKLPTGPKMVARSIWSRTPNLPNWVRNAEISDVSRTLFLVD